MWKESSSSTAKVTNEKEFLGGDFVFHFRGKRATVTGFYSTSKEGGEGDVEKKRSRGQIAFKPERSPPEDLS